MQTILGKLNGTFLVNALSRSYPASKSLRVAVAYADLYDPFVDHFRRHPDVRLKFYGWMDHEIPVSLPLLEWFLEKAPPTAECFLVNGAYHPKVVRFDDYGAYIGSANLTRSGWEKNIEAGVFLTEAELADFGVTEQLDALFEELDTIAIRLTRDLFAKPKVVQDELSRARQHMDAVRRKYDDLFKNEKRYSGQTIVVRPSERAPKARQRFVDEWRGTLELMRSLCREFQAMNKRPAWVSSETNATVHFDQFLHGYYYQVVLRAFDEGDSGSKVDQLYEQNSGDPARALAAAAEWWAGLDSGPSKARYDEETFIRERAPRMRELLSLSSLDAMNEGDFVEAMSNVYAFREYARQVESSLYGLPPNHHESEDDRAERFARWLWQQRSEHNKTAVDLLKFVIYGADPIDAVDRLWLATTDPVWKLPRFGKSSLGEELGWARPDDYPPRNDRTNKALRALGYDVQIFSR